MTVVALLGIGLAAILRHTALITLLIGGMLLRSRDA